MARAVVLIHLHGDLDTITHATADLTAFLRRAHINARPTASGEIRAYLAYPLDPVARAELEFALRTWQQDWPDITVHVSAHP